MVTMLRGMPQPVRTLYFAVFVLFIAGFAVTAITQDPLGLEIGVPSSGVMAIASGIVLCTDYRGNAAKVAELTKTARPWGVDYSQSFLSSVGYVRALGVAIVVVGACFVLAPLLGG